MHEGIVGTLPESVAVAADAVVEAEVGVEKVEVGVEVLREGRGRRGLVRVRRLQSSSLRPATCMVDEDDEDAEEEEDNDEVVFEKAVDILVVMVLPVLVVVASLRLPLTLLSVYLSSLLLFFLFGLSLSFFDGLDALMGREVGVGYSGVRGERACMERVC